jgi:hypothetical protein
MSNRSSPATPPQTPSLRLSRRCWQSPESTRLRWSGHVRRRRDRELPRRGHLAKALIHADLQGHATVGLLFGHTAAGAFIATALAARTLVVLPGAQPAVMDLPSMARVTKLSIEVIEEKAKSKPVFAPGLENLSTDRRSVRHVGGEALAGRTTAIAIGRAPRAPRSARCAGQGAKRSSKSR